jgi:streptomycin 6-kinase
MGEAGRALPDTADSQVLLCTDLHGDNILAAQRAPWLVIDPKPDTGDSPAEASAVNQRPVQHDGR